MKIAEFLVDLNDDDDDLARKRTSTPNSSIGIESMELFGVEVRFLAKSSSSVEKSSSNSSASSKIRLFGVDIEICGNSNGTKEGCNPHGDDEGVQGDSKEISRGNKYEVVQEKTGSNTSSTSFKRKIDQVVSVDGVSQQERKIKQSRTDAIAASPPSPPPPPPPSPPPLQRDAVVAAPPVGMAVNHSDQFNIRKILTKSDVNENARLLLPYDTVKDLILPTLTARDEENFKSGRVIMNVVINDLDTNTRHNLKFKLQPSTKSFILISNWRKNFVKRRQLRDGDEIGMFWDANNLSFGFTVLHQAGLDN